MTNLEVKKINRPTWQIIQNCTLENEVNDNQLKLACSLM